MGWTKTNDETWTSSEGTNWTKTGDDCWTRSDGVNITQTNDNHWEIGGTESNEDDWAPVGDDEDE